MVFPLLHNLIHFSLAVQIITMVASWSFILLKIAPSGRNYNSLKKRIVPIVINVYFWCCSFIVVVAAVPRVIT